MSLHRPGIDPRVRHHFGHAVLEELLALLSFLRFQWGFVLLLVAGLAALIFVVNPFPPSRLTLATGQVNTTFDVIGKKYVEYFLKHGVTLELRTTTGAYENINLLKDKKVDAIFSLGGVSFDEQKTSIVSLGSVEYMPLWLLYTGARFAGEDPEAFFKSKLLSVNIVGSGTFDLTRSVLKLHGIEIAQNKNLHVMSSRETLADVSTGKLDGAFLLGTTASKTIQTLLADPGINVFDFKLADAYVKHLPYLRAIDLPRGGMDIRHMVPPQDLKLIATTATLLTDDRMHPSLQHLFLAATQEISRTDTYPLGSPGSFPAFMDRSERLSEVAARYFEKGPPSLTGRVPFWVATFFDRVWLLLLTSVAIIYPLTKMTPSYRKVYSQLCMADTYIELDVINARLSAATATSDLPPVLEMLSLLEARIQKLWIPQSMKNDYYLLENALEIVRKKATRRRFTLEASAKVPPSHASDEPADEPA